ncbi:MAG: DUF4810 domain-containing protein [Campylobacterales bacterium]|jgi:hypothetical protein
MNVKILLPIAAAAVMMSGCAQKKPLYNYGTYSESYYEHKQEMTDDSALALQKAIEEAIENAKEGTSGRVPPGMYANLGYLYLKSGNSKQAIASFNKEKTIYPESAHFMDRLIKKVETAEGKGEK